MIPDGAARALARQEQGRRGTSLLDRHGRLVDYAGDLDGDGVEEFTLDTERACVSW